MPMPRAVRPLLFSLTALLLHTTAAAEPGKDHPALPRFPGAVLEHYQNKAFEEAQLVLSKPEIVGGKLQAKLLPVEGRVTYLHYEAPKDTSTLQVFRNHQAALRRSGFQTLFSCDRPCGNEHFSNWDKLLKSRGLYLNGGSEELFYLAAQRGHEYVSLAVNNINGEPNVFAFVVEKAELDDGRIPISGNSAIAQGLSRGGRVDVYGFQFDTGKAQLQPGSAATLRELAQVLKDNATLKVDIVGHTDDVGTPEANRALSLARAQAVTAALSKDHAVAADRMLALGQGASQPVAANQNEEGRARNRRVEIVARVSTPTAAAGTTATPSATAAAPAPAPAPAPAAADTTAAAEPAASEAGKPAKANKLDEAKRKLKELLGR